MRHKKNLQQKLRLKKFNYHQYWDVLYIEDYKDGSHKTFATIIKAKSSELVKKIIKQKVGEDIDGAKVKFLQLNMFHKDYSSKKYGKLSLEQWSNIRNAAFPNMLNALHKKHIPELDCLRDKRRQNLKYQQELRGPEDVIGFKKGKNNWSSLNRSKEALPKDKRSGKVWTGGCWVDWDSDDMERTKNSIINALIVNDNVRMKAAEYLGMNRDVLRRLMLRIPDVDWDKDYPPPKPFENVNRNLTQEQRKAISERMKKVMKERMEKGENPFSHFSKEELSKIRAKAHATSSQRRQQTIKSNIPIIKEALLKNGNIRRRAALYLGKSEKWLKYWMDSSNDIVNWDKNYPCPKWKTK